MVALIIFLILVFILYELYFFNVEKYNKIIDWLKPEPPVNLFTYRPRRNNAT